MAGILMVYMLQQGITNYKEMDAPHSTFTKVEANNFRYALFIVYGLGIEDVVSFLEQISSSSSFICGVSLFDPI